MLPPLPRYGAQNPPPRRHLWRVNNFPIGEQPMPKRLTRQELLASDPFAVGANLDLSGFPDFEEPPAEASFVDDKFAPLDDRGAGIGSRELKRFLDDPTYQDLQELAKETGNSDIVDEVEDRRREREANAFVAAP
jgi:hypothetical protein